MVLPVASLKRAVAAGIAVALLVLVVQQHRHARPAENAGCVACAVHAQRATPTSAPVVVAPPVLIALEVALDQDPRPPSLAAPVPRAQGPPAA